MKRMIKNKGITLITLVITIVISLLLIVTVSVSFINVKETNEYYKIKEDIVALQKQVQLYYLKEGKIPLTNKNYDNNFYNKINKTENIRDKNPNDDNNYLILYDRSESKKYYGDLLPEVNIQSTGSKYVINAKSLTVYCTDGYLLDNERHFTASSDFSGGRFASEYYQKLTVLNLGDLGFSCYTDTKINGKEYLQYAKLGSTITLKITLKEEVYDINTGKHIVFGQFKKKPEMKDFKLKISDLNNGQTERQTLNATSLDFDSDGGKTCTIKFKIPENLNVSGWHNRRKITFSYDGEIYYDEDNKVDYKSIINNYFNITSIELEDNEEEILIAATMNESSSVLSNFITNIQKISGWTYKHTYTDIISAPSGQKYAIPDARTFNKAYTIVLNFISNPTDVPRNGPSAAFTVNGTNANYTSNSIVATPGVQIKAISSCSGFNNTSSEYTMQSQDKIYNVTLNAVTYTFTLKSNTSGSALALTNTTRSSTFAPSGSTSDQTRTVNAYIGDAISYNVTKDYYRFNGDVGKAANAKTYTMAAGNETKNVTLVKNTPEKTTGELKVETKCVYKIFYVDRDQQEKTSTFNYAESAYNNVQKVDLYVVYSYDIGSSKGIEYNISFSNNGFNSIKHTGWKLDDNETGGPYTIYNSNEWPSNYVIPQGSTCTIYQKQNYNQASTYTTKSYFKIYCAEK